MWFAISFFLIFIGIPILLIIFFNRKEFKRYSSAHEDFSSPEITDRIRRLYASSLNHTTTPEEDAELQEFYAKDAAYNRFLHNQKEYEELRTDRRRVKAYRDAALGIIASTITIGSIIADSRNDYQHMLDTDKR